MLLRAEEPGLRHAEYSPRGGGGRRRRNIAISAPFVLLPRRPAELGGNRRGDARRRLRNACDDALAAVRVRGALLRAIATPCGGSSGGGGSGASTTAAATAPLHQAPRPLLLGQHSAAGGGLPEPRRRRAVEEPLSGDPLYDPGARSAARRGSGGTSAAATALRCGGGTASASRTIATSDADASASQGQHRPSRKRRRQRGGGRRVRQRSRRVVQAVVAAELCRPCLV